MTSPYPPPMPPQQPPRGNWFSRHKALTAVGAFVIATVVIGSIAGTSGDSDSDTAAPAATSSPQPPGPAATSAPRGDHLDHVTVDSCTTAGNLGWPQAELTVSNLGSDTASYTVHVEFLDPDSVRLSNTFTYTSRLEPGTKAKETARGTGDTAGKPVTCRVTRVDRTRMP